MDKSDIKQLKKKVDDARQKLAGLQGREEYLLERLKKEFKCSDLSTARKKAVVLKKEITDMELRITEAIQQLEEDYEGQD